MAAGPPEFAAGVGVADAIRSIGRLRRRSASRCRAAARMVPSPGRASDLREAAANSLSGLYRFGPTIAAKQWLDESFDSIGREGTLNLRLASSWPVFLCCSGFEDGDSHVSALASHSHTKSACPISHHKAFHGHREPDNQAIGFPLVGYLASELPYHEPAHERTSKAFMFRRPVEGWAAMLLPGQ
jgi:hypothetical protein